MTDQVDEINELKAQQMAAHTDPSSVKKIKANLDPKIEIKETERDYVHILLTQRLHNEATKEYINETRVLRLHPTNLEAMIATGIFGGYDDAKVIHDPRTNRPKDYKLKAEPVPQGKIAPSAPVDDSVLAAKEQRIADLEKRLAAIEGANKKVEPPADLPELEAEPEVIKPTKPAGTKKK